MLPSLNNSISEVSKERLLWISYSNDVPSTSRGIQLIIHLDDNGQISFSQKEDEYPDPSTIWITLPIREGYADKLPYFPHYIDLTPEQRFAYLTWLKDIEQPTDMGFVFLYFYGLERHLVSGDIDRAIPEIIKLRNAHSNRSFQNYSEAAIIHGCIMRNRFDLLIDIQDKTEITGFTNSQIYTAYALGNKLGAENLLEVFVKAFPKSKKAIREDRANMLKFTNEALNSIYSDSSLDISDLNVTKGKKVKERRFCNYTFPDDIIEVSVHDFYVDKQFMAKVEAVFNLAYENYKKYNALQRKMQSSGMPEEELMAKEKKRNLSRYKKLLSDGKITQEEYFLLANALDNNTIMAI